jgi:anti-sigma factor RsiW
MNGRTAGGASASCDDFEWLIGSYLDGELPQGECWALEEHLQQCSACNSHAERLRRLDSLTKAVYAPVPEVSATEWGHLWERIQRRARGFAPAADRPRRAWLAPLLSVAALLCLGAWIGFSLLQDPPAPGSQEPPISKREADKKIRILDGVPVKVRSDSDADTINYLERDDG